MRPRILCVEDHFDTRELMSLLLSGYEITFAIGKSEAVERAREREYALILMDLQLIDGSGETACMMIRTFDRETPILFVTASTQFTQNNALAIGAQGTLHKGIVDFVGELRRRVADFVYGEVRLNDRQL